MRQLNRQVENINLNVRLQRSLLFISVVEYLVVILSSFQVNYDRAMEKKDSMYSRKKLNIESDGGTCEPGTSQNAEKSGVCQEKKLNVECGNSGVGMAGISQEVMVNMVNNLTYF